VSLFTATVSGFTPSSIGEGLEFDISRHLRTYLTESDRDTGTSPQFQATLPPGETLPKVVTGDKGTVRFLSYDGAGFDFLIKALGIEEGEQAGTVTILASIQPLTPGDAAQSADLTQGKQAVRLYTKTMLKSVEGGEADRVILNGKTYEVVAVEDWTGGPNPHCKILARAYNPVVTA
jgi:hypothetical protein